MHCVKIASVQEYKAVYRIYTDRSHYQPLFRGELFDLLRPFWKEYPATVDNIAATYGPVFDYFTIVTDCSEADLSILPMSWNYYLSNGRIDQALAFIKSARKYDKPILTQTTGDFGVTPPIDDVYVLRCSGYRSREPLCHIGQPTFIRDPLREYYAAAGIFPRSKGPRPLVGFCGQSRTTPLGAGFDMARTILQNLSYYCGVRAEEPQDIYPSIRRRVKALGLLERSTQVETRFIRRNLYRAGARTVEERWNTALEFYNNIRDTDYTLCLRGGGNFSVRFYETLAMGRIPLFVNTDCLLPYDHNINWKDHVVWIEEGDMDHVAEIIREFHNNIHPDDFVQMQIKNRKLWEDKLTFTGFYSSLDSLLCFN